MFLGKEYLEYIFKSYKTEAILDFKETLYIIIY